jgi:hypothetical protein
MEDVDSDTGRTGYLMTDGQFVYTSVVTLVNIKLLTSANTHTFYTFLFSLGSIASFILAYFLLSLMPSDILYKDFS